MVTSGAATPTPSTWVRSIGAVTGNTILSTVGLVLVAVVTARQLGPEGRGTIVLFISISSFATLLSSLGANVRARVDLAKDQGIARGEYLGLVLALLALQVVVTLSAGSWALSASGGLYATVAVPLLCAYGTGLLASVLMRDLLYAYGLPARASSGEAVGAGVLLTATVLLAVSGYDGVTGYLVAFVLSGLAQMAHLGRGLHRAGLFVRPKFAPAAWRTHVRASLPALVQSFAQAGVFRGDRLILGVLAGTGAVGVYSVAATMTELLWLIPVSIGNALFLRVSNGTVSASTVRKLRAANFALAVVCAAALALLGPTVLRVVFGEEFVEATDVLRVLCLSAVVVSSYHLDIVRVTGTGALAAGGKLVLTGFVVTVVADLALIPPFGVIGAAWGTVIGYLALAVGSDVVARRISSRKAVAGCL